MDALSSEERDRVRCSVDWHRNLAPTRRQTNLRKLTRRKHPLTDPHPYPLPEGEGGTSRCSPGCRLLGSLSAGAGPALGLDDSRFATSKT